MPLAAASACGLVAALFYLSVLTGSSGSLILVYLVQLPLFGAGLSLGVKAAAVAAGTATLATAAASGVTAGGLFLVAEALPVVFLVRQALLQRPTEARNPDGGWSSPGFLAVSLVLLGSAVLAGAAALLAFEPEGFHGSVQHFLAAQLGQLFAEAQATTPGGDAASVEVAAGEMAKVFPALAVASWLLMMTINGVLAQGALARFALNRRPSPDIATLTVPRWLLPAIVAAALAAVAIPGDLGYLGGNLMPVLAVAYVFAGLGVLHAAARRFAGRIFILIPAYAILLAGLPVVLLAACGIIDQWFGLRSRFAAAAPRQGEE
jgi:hypothetical protein